MKSLSTVQKEIFDFLAIDPGMKVAIVSDDDEDGTTSAVAVRLFLEMSGCETRIFFHNHNINTPTFISSFKRDMFDRTVFLDLNESFVTDILETVGTNTGKFLVIDHHQENELSHASFDYLIIKPWNFSKIMPSQYPTAKMVYDLFGGIDWISAIGVIGDSAQNEWASFLKEVCKKNNLTENELNEIVGIISATLSTHKDKINDLYEFLCSARTPKDIFSSWFSSLKKEFDESLELEKKKFYKEAKFVEDADVYFYETRANLRSKLSNIISKEIPNKLIVLFEDQGFMMGASLRRQDFKINCGEIAAFAVNGARDGSGGGHVPAAAAKFRRTYCSTFKDKVLLYLRTNYPIKKKVGTIGSTGRTKARAAKTIGKTKKKK